MVNMCAGEDLRLFYLYSKNKGPLVLLLRRGLGGFNVPARNNSLEIL